MNKVSKQIEINAPVEFVFALFNSFTHFPRWMKGVKKVEPVASGRTRWRAEAPDGTFGEWETEITELEPGRRVAWRATANSILAAAGEASFEESRPGATLMRLALGYDAPAEQADKHLATAFNENLAQRLAEDLIWFRLLAEREVQTHSNHGSIEVVTAPPLSTGGNSQPFTQLADKTPVHFDTFSSIRSAGQLIRPARLVTAFLNGRQARRATHAPIIVNLDPAAPRPNNKAVALAARPRDLMPVPLYRSIIASVIVVGMLFISGASWLAASRWPTAPVTQHHEVTTTAVTTLPLNEADRPAAAAGIESTATFEPEAAVLPAAATGLASAPKTKPASKTASKQARGKRSSTRWLTAWLQPVVKPFTRKKSAHRRR